MPRLFNVDLRTSSLSTVLLWVSRSMLGHEAIYKSWSETIWSILIQFKDTEPTGLNVDNTVCPKGRRIQIKT